MKVDAPPVTLQALYASRKINSFGGEMGNWSLGNLQGLIPIFGGIYGYLLATGTLPKSPKKPEEMEVWRNKFGPMMKILGPAVAFWGMLELFAVL